MDLRNYKRVRLQAPRVLPGSIARTLQTRTNNKMLTCVPQDAENSRFCAQLFHPNEEAVSVCSECGGDRLHQGNPDPHPGGSPAGRRTAAARNQRRGQWR